MGFLADKRRARRFYRYLSMVYDRLNPLVWTEDMRDRSIDLLELEPDMQVLDVGCGTGFGAIGLLQEVEGVIGIDQSPEQLGRARRKLPADRTDLMLGDAERLPYENNSFDVVWSSGSIEYWPRPVSTLRELHRVCRPGGQVLVVGPNMPQSRLLGALADRLMLFYDRGEADEMFRAAGFEAIDHELMGPWYNRRLAITTIARVPS